VTVRESDLVHVRRAFEAFNERFATPRESEPVDEYYREFYEPDAVIEQVDSFPTLGRFVGLEGYREYFGDAYGPYEDLAWDVQSLVPVGDRIVALVSISGRPRGEELRLQVQVGITYEMGNGRIRHVRAYLSHDRALEAARAVN
jgi:ketosteroid isomerase-like protein